MSLRMDEMNTTEADFEETHQLTGLHIAICASFITLAEVVSHPHFNCHFGEKHSMITTCRFVHTHTHTHTQYIHTYKHTYIHTCIHLYKHTFIHACIHT